MVLDSSYSDRGRGRGRGRGDRGGYFGGNPGGFVAPSKDDREIYDRNFDANSAFRKFYLFDQDFYSHVIQIVEGPYHFKIKV